MWFGVFEHKVGGRYLLADVVGSRVFRQQPRAMAFADRMLRDRAVTPLGGFVVRSLTYVDCRHAVIGPRGVVSLTAECPCPLPGSNNDPACVFHGQQ